MWPAILRPHGHVVVYGAGPQANIPGSFCLTNNINVRFILVYEMAASEIDRAVADISKLLAEGRLVHNIALTLPLAEIVRAHEAVEPARPSARSSCKSENPPSSTRIGVDGISIATIASTGWRNHMTPVKLLAGKRDLIGERNIHGKRTGACCLRPIPTRRSTLSAISTLCRRRKPRR